jgi:hypothetical protein
VFTKQSNQRYVTVTYFRDKLVLSCFQDIVLIGNKGSTYEAIGAGVA